MTVQDHDDADLAEHIEACRRTWTKERDLEFPNPQVHLEFAKALLRSPDRAHLLEAHDILDDMIEEGLLIDESCYAQAVCKFKLGLRAESSEYLARVLQLDPGNEKAQQLQEILEATASREGKATMLLGVALSFSLFVLVHSKLIKPFFSQRS